MPGTKAGASKARGTITKRYGEDFYKRIGAKGGSTPTLCLKGFAANRELASIAGKKGGHISRRGKKNA